MRCDAMRASERASERRGGGTAPFFSVAFRTAPARPGPGGVWFFFIFVSTTRTPPTVYEEIFISPHHRASTRFFGGQNKITGVEFLALNTDAQHLSTSLSPNRLQIGAQLTSGLGE